MESLIDGSIATAIDIVARISIVLATSLVIAWLARRNAARRHVVLIVGLAGAFLTPAAMYGFRTMDAPRWQLFLPRVPTPKAPFAELKSPTTEQVPLESRGAALTAKSHSTRTVSGQFIGTPSPSSPRTGAKSTWSVLNGGVFLVFLVGAAVRLAGLCLSVIRLRRVAARATPINVDVVDSLLLRIRQRLQLRITPRLLETTEVQTPMAAGVIGNYVLLPTGFSRTLTVGELTAVLCHETAHLVRRDHRIIILQEILGSVFWFHPLVHYFNHALSRAREGICDNYAIGVMERPEYCSTLLRLASAWQRPSLRGATTMWLQNWPLEARIRGILDEKRQVSTRLSGTARLAAVVCALVVCLLMSLPQVTASQAEIRGAQLGQSNGKQLFEVVREQPVMTREIFKSFPTMSKLPLHLENLAGTIEITSGDGTSIEVAATIHVDNLGEAELKELLDRVQWVQVPSKEGAPRQGLSIPIDRFPIVRYTNSGQLGHYIRTVRYIGQEVRVTGEASPSIPTVAVDLRISIPTNAKLSLENGVGPIRCQDVSADLTLSAQEGPITLVGTRGRISATSANGNIVVRRLDSDAILWTSTGKVELSEVTGGNIAVTTESGDCRIVHGANSDFKMQFSGDRAVEIIGGNVRQLSSYSAGRSASVLSRGAGGPSFVIACGSGRCVLGPGP
jgi:beta-lactamase regulating signal transducer with metallopeptidase domain